MTESHYSNGTVAAQYETTETSYSSAFINSEHKDLPKEEPKEAFSNAKTDSKDVFVASDSVSNSVSSTPDASTLDALLSDIDTAADGGATCSETYTADTTTLLDKNGENNKTDRDATSIQGFSSSEGNRSRTGSKIYAPRYCHLFVLVHGLGGTPEHLQYISDELKTYLKKIELNEADCEELEESSDNSPSSDYKLKQRTFKILNSKANDNNLTFDGIDLCGCRLVDEIEIAKEYCNRNNMIIDKFSIVGYSLGGLIARYAIGKLYSRKFFDEIQPILFSTFATPHVGCTDPQPNLFRRMMLYLGSKSLSVTGVQLFMSDTTIPRPIDPKDESIGQPLLVELSRGVFFTALSAFKERCVYSNIANDFAVSYCTSNISEFNPFVDLSRLNIKYLKNYGNVILDPAATLELVHQMEHNEEEKEKMTVQRKIHSFFTSLDRDTFKRGLFYCSLPLFLATLLSLAAYQTFNSRKRIGKESETYRLYDEALLDDSNGREEGFYGGSALAHKMEVIQNKNSTLQDLINGVYITDHHQKKIVENLSRLRWEKFCVHIQLTRRSHAAMIVRNLRNRSWWEGKHVIRHWIETQVVPVITH